MNRKTIHWGLVLWMMGSVVGLMRVEAQVKVPPAPCIWTASYEYKVAEPPRPQDPREAKMYDRMRLIAPKPKLKTVYSTDDKQRMVVQWMVGRSTENWVVGDLQLLTALNFPEGQVTTRTLSPEERRGIEGVSSVFPELSWLKEEYLAGKVSYQGASALHYIVKGTSSKKTQVNSAATAGDSAPVDGAAPKQEAWIDAKTGFPMAMENESMRVTYKLLSETPSASDMKMPPEFEKVWQRATNP
jgi:hypothetical protein